MYTRVGLVDLTSEIVKAWNDEFQTSFPLTERLFRVKTWDHECYHNDLSYALVDGNHYVGSIVIKTSNLSNHANDLYIAFIHVANEYRNHGIGSSLLNETIADAKRNHYERILLGTDEGCLFSGVFWINNHDTHQFFIQNGFQHTSTNYNLIAQSIPKTNFEDSEVCVKRGVSFEEKQQMLAFIQRCFSERWLKEAVNASENDLVVLFYQNQIAGFCVTCFAEENCRPNSANLFGLYDHLAGIGPLGIDPEIRSKGYGKILVNQTLRILFNLGAHAVMVDWTGLVDFYKKCGFEGIVSQYLEYSLKMEEIQ